MHMNDDAYCVLMRIIGKRRDRINCLKTSKYRKIVYQPLLSPGPRFGSLLSYCAPPNPFFSGGHGGNCPFSRTPLPLSALCASDGKNHFSATRSEWVQILVISMYLYCLTARTWTIGKYHSTVPWYQYYKPMYKLNIPISYSLLVIVLCFFVANLSSFSTLSCNLSYNFILPGKPDGCRGAKKCIGCAWQSWSVMVV